MLWPWRPSKFTVDDYVIEVGHLSKFSHEHKLIGEHGQIQHDAQGNVRYETDYLCIFRVKFAESWTVYFRHLEIPLENHTKEWLARFLLENLRQATPVFDFNKSMFG